MHAQEATNPSLKQIINYFKTEANTHLTSVAPLGAFGIKKKQSSLKTFKQLSVTVAMCQVPECSIK